MNTKLREQRRRLGEEVILFKGHSKSNILLTLPIFEEYFFNLFSVLGK